MTPTVRAPDLASSTGKALEVSSVAGGREIDLIGGPSTPTITDTEFRGALIDALQATGLFSSVASDGTGDYRLETHILAQMVNPKLDLDVVAQLLVDYRLLDASTDAIIWTGNIYSSKRVTLGEELIGMIRAQRALEGAARDNLTQLISMIADAVEKEAGHEPSPGVSKSENLETGTVQ